MLVAFVLFVSTTIVLAFLATNKRYRWIYILAKTYKRDILGFIAIYQIKKWANKYLKEQPTVASEIEGTAKRHLKKPALYCEGEMWTYEMVLQFQNKLARFIAQEEYKKGDTIALLLENSNEYPCVWFGLSKLGITTALINTNLTKSSLLHSITVANSKGIIFGSNFADRIRDIAGSLTTVNFYEYQAQGNISGLLSKSCNLHLALKNVSYEDIGNKFVKKDTKDPLLYIYTSGTTGLPKATVMTNMRCLILLRSTIAFLRLTEDYVTYVALPLYHLAGGIQGVAGILLTGGTVVIAKKFSATNFFKNCNKYNCNSTLYIGEMCRYLLALPESTPIKHNVKYFAGIGLRPQIWYKFVKRFNIKQVWEMYSSTEGVLSLINLDNTPGSIGYIPRYLFKYSPLRIIKCDEVTGEPKRNEDGFCTLCGVDEPGLAIGKIDTKKVTTTFEGYTDKEATYKKLLRNVFVPGDVYMNSGDILVYNELGNFYIKDRVGDTYRWKSENVSSMEVESIINEVVGLSDVVVFGVKIPETEGTAGMAVINDINNNINFESLGAQLAPLLPHYALPIFIRAVSSLQLTGTYKFVKKELSTEGFNIHKIKDPIYFYDSSQEKYVKLSKEMYEKIISGQMRL